MRAAERRTVGRAFDALPRAILLFVFCGIILNNDIFNRHTIMDLLEIRDPGIRATALSWLNETRELFVELYYPHSGGSGWFYLLTSPGDLTQLIQQARDGALFFLLKHKQFPLRGIVDDAFVNQARAIIADGEQYLITDLATYPKHLSFFGDGQTHKQLLADLHDLRGVRVGVGHEPDTNPEYWKGDMHPDRLTAMKKAPEALATND